MPSQALSTDERHMTRCLELALNGAGRVAPNPMVGAVIVHHGTIIGEGFHEKVGEAHAEVNAIHTVRNRSLLPDSTIYVSLEPCAHFGKTPPCADLIVANRIKRVVIACLDPFAKVNGAGIKRLMESGAEVKLGVLEKEALELNRRFFTFHQKKRPYIILKWAETADGSVDKRRSDSQEPPLSVTCYTANVLVHRWRAEEAAIMIGKNTALLDDPSLTTRHFRGKNPIRILLDTNAETPASAKIFSNEAETIVLNGNTTDLHQLLAELHERDIHSVIVEGGPTLHRSFYQAGLWDEIRRFVSPIRIGKGIPALSITEEPETVETVGTDQLLTYRNR